MYTRPMIGVVGSSLIAGMLLLVSAEHTSPSVASIEGSYALESRDLPDGTTVTEGIVGMMTFTKEYRNFNVWWRTPEGEDFSLSVVSRYSLSSKAYTEECLYRCVVDPEAEGPVHDTSGARGTSPVTMEGGEIAFDMPLFDEPAVVFTADGFTATRDGEFVDHWKKVK